MQPLFQPRLVNGVFGDPVLYLESRDEPRALMFDLGDVSALPPRRLLRLSDVFVSHAHMDHFAGFDHLLRVVLGRKARLVLHGGPGFVEQVGHKLGAYTWNVVHRYDVELQIEVRELGLDGRVRIARYSSRREFAREDVGSCTLEGDVLLDEATFRVRARYVDHGIPCLAFALEEKARLKVMPERLAALGVTTGAWLRELKQAVLTGAPPATPIHMQWRDKDGVHETTRSVGELRELVLDTRAGRRIGYATDLRYTPHNIETLATLMAGADPLYIESVFLHADEAHGERKNHLTARQAGEIARRAGARSLVAFHHSPRYQGREGELAQEAQAAWQGLAGDDHASDADAGCIGTFPPSGNA
jgi:ribonuclease Z